jgi:hypothetical protein
MNETLNQDRMLSFLSGHGRNAHFREETVYVAKERAVVHTSTCTRLRWLRFLPPKVTESREVLELPPEITTREELENYVRKHRRHWMRHR